MDVIPMSNYTLTRVEEICHNYIIPCICGFGMICNVLNLAVLSRRHMKESPYSYLFGLAVADLSVLSLSFIESVFSRRFGDGIFTWKVYDAYIFLPLANVFANASVWITVLLTMERWVSVKFPLKAKDVCTRSLARKAMLAVFILSFIINIPRFMCQKIVRGNNSYYETKPTEFGQEPFYKGVTWFYVCTIHIVPCMVLVTLNSCLISLVYQANKRRNVLQESSRRQRGDELPSSREQIRLTITCISIIVLFLICIIPSAFSNRPVTYALFGKGVPQLQFFEQPFYRLFRVVTNMLVFCNLSLNFVLYCVFNNKFMRTLHFLFRNLVQHIVKRGEREQRRRLSRRSSTSSSTYMRGTGAHGFLRRATLLDGNKFHCDPCQAMYFHIESYPLTRGSYHIPRPTTKKRQRLELSSNTEVSDTF